MSSNPIPFPSKQETLDLPPPRVWKLADLTGFLRVSKSWVYKRTTPTAEDPIPHIANMGVLRFDTANAEFQAWMARHLRCGERS